MTEIKVKVLDNGGNLNHLSKGSEHAAGLDLRAADTGCITGGGGWGLIPCGVALEIPPGFEAQVRPRSGLALKRGLTVLNSPGTIDSDYRGEIGIILINFGHYDFVYERGERLAQLVISRVEPVSLSFVESLSDTDRGEGGYGSSGVSG